MATELSQAHARGVADFLHTDHHEERLNSNLAADLFGEIGSWMDEPLSDPSVVPTYLLSRFTRQHVTVALGGDGGDEIFAGYQMYPAHRVARLYERVPTAARRLLIESIVKRLPVKTKNLSLDFKARKFIEGMRYDDVVMRHHIWFGSFTPGEQQKLLTPAARGATGVDIYAGARALLDECDAVDTVERMQYLDTKLYLAEDILTKVDRTSMAVSLEVRAPFLDRRLVEYVASLPVHYKLHGNTTKYILKRAMGPHLPPFVTRRGKKGFGVPIAEWLKGRLRPLARDLLSPARLSRHGLFDPAYVARLQDAHERGAANHRKLLWTLLIFELWHESFIETPRRMNAEVRGQLNQLEMRERSGVIGGSLVKNGN
ncbi:MAG: asparagine synthase C-terminal domain-containing protein [Acidobacteria bacterium]|nr:asparagine synthase C-terminal domain-containing protein [Acidobacteriota bacterium]